MEHAQLNRPPMKPMTFHLKIWRQKNAHHKGSMVDYTVKDISPDASFLEMIDVLNGQLAAEGQDTISFDHDCREGICGSCAMMINGLAHGPLRGTTVCQLHMRNFKDGQEIIIEPWRARAFPVIKDLCVDRSSFDEIVKAGAYISVKTGNAPDAHAIPVQKAESDESFTAAACIGCGACVAACKNASAMLFVSAKVSQYALLPQGEPERTTRAISLVEKMDEMGFGNCTNEGECEAVCPKSISLRHIARLNREYLKAKVSNDS